MSKFEQGKTRNMPKISAVEAEQEYRQFIPEEFKHDPIGYFEREGKNIKPGDIEYGESGRIKEDPTAVKELPAWHDSAGNKINVIGKKVNLAKGEIGKSGDPFYEYKVLQIVHKLGLPAPNPIAKAEFGDRYLIVMEKVAGVNWHEKNNLQLAEKGYMPNDIENLKTQAEQKMTELRQKFDEAGIIRGWKLKDMIFDIDIENKTVRKITPVDFERTVIDEIKLQEALQKLNEK